MKGHVRILDEDSIRICLHRKRWKKIHSVGIFVFRSLYIGGASFGMPRFFIFKIFFQKGVDNYTMMV